MTSSQQATSVRAVTGSYCVSPITRIDRPLGVGNVRISAGSGAARETVDIDSPRLMSCLIDAASPKLAEVLIGDLAERLSIEQQQAVSIVNALVAAGILITDGEARWLFEAGREWEHYGWRDAFDFHFSGFGHKWDRTRRQEYVNALLSLYDDVDAVGQQPAATYEREGAKISLAEHCAPISASLLDTLNTAIPINVFTEFGVSLGEIASLLAAAHGVEFTRNLVLGEHFFKASPSGGARHPIEVYLVARDVGDLPQGAYHYEAKSNELTQIRGAEAAEELDATCFDKGGIKTSSAVFFFTYRYQRHAWKYRYSRTYRAVLLELGHSVQTTRLAAAGLGLHVYYNPAIHDSLVRELLSLGEDCDEGPVLSMGLGRGGTV